MEEDVVSKELGSVVRKVMRSTLKIMPAIDFAAGILVMVQSNDSNVRYILDLVNYF